MLDRFEAMAMFLKVIERGSLSAAGRALGVPVPTLSRRVSDLEAHLGARLLIRTTRKITLTDTGLAYAEAAARILEHVRDAETQAAGEYVALRGELVLTAPVLFGRLHVLPVVIDFLAAYSQINVRLALSDRNAHLVDDQIDMAVRIGALPGSSLIATTVGTMRTVVCASPALLAQYGEPQTPADLQAMPTIVVDTFGMGRWHFGQDRDPIAVTPRLTVSTTEAAAEAAARGVGVVRLLHYQAAGPVAQGDLRIVLTAFEPPPMPVHLVHLDRGAMPLKMRAFLDFAAPRLRRALRGLAQNCN
jgi:DNA-binding transcriptional LysR family regulator